MQAVKRQKRVILGQICPSIIECLSTETFDDDSLTNIINSFKPFQKKSLCQKLPSRCRCRIPKRKRTLKSFTAIRP